MKGELCIFGLVPEMGYSLLRRTDFVAAVRQSFQGKNISNSDNTAESIVKLRKTTHRTSLTPTPNSHSTLDTKAFTFRTGFKPEQKLLVSLGTKILQSYPLMVLRDGCTPPFISSELVKLASEGKGPKLKVPMIIMTPSIVHTNQEDSL